jgi:hypothetical protein
MTFAALGKFMNLVTPFLEQHNRIGKVFYEVIYIAAAGNNQMLR